VKTSGNTVLITGGATGIGYAMAEAFLKQGNEVIICGRREQRLREAKKNHSNLQILACDVTDDAGRNSLVESVASNFKSLNVLVNNAGIQRDIDFTKGIADFLAGPNEIAVNLEAPILLSGLFIPHLAGKDGAAIVNISSGLGFVPAAKMPVYSATKAGLHAFSMALRHQLQTIGIKVFEVVPPAVDSELNPDGRAKRGGFKVDLQPREFVAAVMKGLADETFEIGYGYTLQSLKASREDLDKAFQQMNSRW
jgi:uncharacterized oxidoreductase